VTQLLAGRRALVTGASRGIGRGIAIALAQAGADVAVNYRKGKQEADEVVAAITALGRKAIAVQADVSVREDVARMADETLAGLGDLDVIVHNAGIASRGLSVGDTARDEVERVLAVHAISPHDLTARLLPALRRHSRSDVVFISSAEVGAMHANGAPYNMGKTAMEALALTLAKEEASNGVRVNIVAPGLVITDMVDKLVKAMTGSGSDALDVESLFPFKRACQPEDVAAVVVAVLSPAFGYVTGQSIGVDGGINDIDQIFRAARG